MDFRRPLQTVTPTLDGEVLEVLARTDGEMTGREIQQIAGHGSRQGIRNAAERLTAQGVLLRRSAGSAHMYRLNRDHLAAPYIEGLAGLGSQLLERLRTALAGWQPPPTLAVMFGSVAAGQATHASDLDLLIVRSARCDPDTPGWQAQLADLQERATAWSGNDARVLEYDEHELARTHAEPVLREALGHGILLYGSQRTLRRLRREQAPR